MRTNILIHKISVRRRVAGAANDFNETVYTWAYAYQNIRARVETYNANQQYNTPGERDFKKIIIYLEPDKVIYDQDEIYFPVGALIGVVNGVNPALMGTSSALDHIEITVEPK